LVRVIEKDSLLALLDLRLKINEVFTGRYHTLTTMEVVGGGKEE
jgi:hypothetical protein